MKHFASPAFWESFEKLPRSVQEHANRWFEFLKANPQHPSLHFKTIGKYRSVRIGLHYTWSPFGLVPCFFLLSTYDFRLATLSLSLNRFLRLNPPLKKGEIGGFDSGTSQKSPQPPFYKGGNCYLRTSS